MSKCFRKVLSLIIASVMLVSAMPITAFASDAELVALKDAIAAYESKMDGTVYENMKDAYDKYIVALDYAYAYEYGNRTDLDLGKAADNLSAATTLMENNVWSGVSFTTPQLNYGGAVPGEFVKNLLFCTAPASITGFVNQKWQVAFMMPKTAVFLYDGNNIRIPVMVGGNNQGQWAGLAKAFCAVWPTTGNANANDDNRYFQFNQVWNGSYQMETGSNDTPLSANEFKWSAAYNEDEQSNKGDTLKGYNNTSQASTNKDYRSQKINCNAINENHKKLWYQYANYLEYVDSAKNLEWNNGLQEAKIHWGVKSWEQGNNLYYAYYNPEVTFYVVDYRGVPEAITTASTYFDFDYSDGKAAKLYANSQLDSILASTEALLVDPSVGFSTSNIKTKAAELASNAKANINAINNATITTSDLSDYEALGQMINNLKALYNGNNSSGTYTADSFAAFKTAYQASVAEAAAVAENGFTSVSTYNALVAAYKALNVVVEPSGSTGTANYTYDEETGVATITGPGAMGDYESGDESPFGNNEDITEVVIGDDVTYVGENAFKGCRNLKKITVPATATYGKGAFDDCPELEEVIIIKGEIKKVNATNAPWTQPSVEIVRLGEDKDDYSLTGFANGVFSDLSNCAVYVYNPECTIPDINNSSFGINPTIWGNVPSTARTYAEDYNYIANNFRSLGHEHFWIVDSIVEPTCTKGGYTLYKCKYSDFCSQTKKADFVDPAGHIYDAGVVTPATCTERGYTTVTCQVCGYSKKDSSSYVNALGHDFSGTYAPNYASPSMKNDSTEYKHSVTCNNGCGTVQTDYCTFVIDGNEVVAGQNCIKFRCSVCGGIYYYPTEASAGSYSVFFFDTDNQLMKVVSVEAGQKISAEDVPGLNEDTEGVKYSWQLDGVDYDPVNKTIIDNTVFKMAATYEEYTVTYVIDGATDSAEQVKYGNKPSNVPDLKSDIIRRTDGHLIYVWENGINPAEQTITGPVTFNMVTELVPHNFTDTVLEEPTCSTEGVMSRFCNDCEYRITGVSIPTVPHNLVTDKGTPATCTKSGLTDGAHCTNCDYVVEQTVIPPIEHKWDKGKITVQATTSSTGKIVYTCTVCKTTKAETIPKLTIADITPSDKVADAAPVNKNIQKPKKIRTQSLIKKKQMKISFKAVAGAQNYRVMYRKAGTKKWNYAWTNGKTQYYLKKLKVGGMYEFQFAAYKMNSSGNWERGAYSKITRRYYFKHAIKSLKPSAGKIKVTWKKKKGASTYQIQYALKRNMKGGKLITVTNPNAASYEIKGLKKGKTYYVRIRANKKYKGKNYIGEYSKRLKVKVK